MDGYDDLSVMRIEQCVANAALEAALFLSLSLFLDADRPFVRISFMMRAIWRKFSNSLNRCVNDDDDVTLQEATNRVASHW